MTILPPMQIYKPIEPAMISNFEAMGILTALDAYLRRLGIDTPAKDYFGTVTLSGGIFCAARPAIPNLPAPIERFIVHETSSICHELIAVLEDGTLYLLL